MKYARELIYGAVGYIAGVAILRSLPSAIIPTTFNLQAFALIVGSMIIFGSLSAWVASGRPAEDRLASGVAMALPVLLGDACEMTAYSTVYPNFDPASSGVFASILLFTNIAIVSGGLIAAHARGRGSHRAPATRPHEGVTL